MSKSIQKIKKIMKESEKRAKEIKKVNQRDKIIEELGENSVFLLFIIFGIIFWIITGFAMVGICLISFGIGMIAGYEIRKLGN